MRSFQRIKEINGIQYVYEITPYYDSKEKRTKQRSKYLGKLVDGGEKRMRGALPRSALDYGELLPAFKVIDELGLQRMLEELLPEERARTVLALAINRVVQPLIVSNVRAWYERTILSRLWSDVPLSSQGLSDFLEALGGSTMPEQFTELLLERTGKSEPLLYDITSFSSSSNSWSTVTTGTAMDFRR